MVLFLVGLPAAAAVLTANTEWGRNRIKSAAVQAIHDELGLEASLGEVELDLIPFPRVDARTISLSHPEHGQLAEADGLTIRPSLAAFLTGQVDLQTVEIRRPEIRLLIRDGKIQNFPELAPGDGDVDLPFRTLLIENASLTVDAEPYAKGSLTGVTGQLEADGPSLRIEAEVAGGEVEHSLGTEVIEKLSVAVGIEPEYIGVERVTVATQDFGVDVWDATLPMPLDETLIENPDMEGYVRVRANLAHLRDLPHAWELPELSGEAEVEAQLRGSDQGPTAQGLVAVSDTIVDERGVGAAEIRFEADPNGIRITEGHYHVESDGGDAQISGFIDFQAEGFPLEAQVDIDDLRFAKLLAQLGVTENAIVQWPLSGRIEVGGTLSPLDLRGPIQLATEDFLITRDAYHQRPQRRIMGVTRASVRGQIRVIPDALRFEHLTGETPNSRLYVDEVHLGFDNQVRVVGRGDIDLADVSPLMDFPLGGRGQGTVDVSGTFSYPNVSGHATVEDFAFNTFVVGDVDTDWRLENEGLLVRFPSMTAVKNNSRYRVDDLTLDFADQRFEIGGTLVAQRMELADLYQIFHYEEDERFTGYQGVIAGRSGIRYTLGFPRDGPTGTLDLDLDLEIPEVEVSGFAFNDGAFRGRWHWVDYQAGAEGGELTIDRLHLRKGAGTLAIDGRMGLGGVLEMTASADRLAFRDLEGIGDRMPELAGVASLMADIRGTSDLPRASIDINLSGVSYKRALLGDGRLYVRMTDRDDPWVRSAQGWDPEAPPPGESCAAGRSGFARGRWNPDPPLQTIEGPKPRLTRPMAFVICGSGFDNQVQLDLAVGRTQAYPLRGKVEVENFNLTPFLAELGSDVGLDGTTDARVVLTDGAALRPGSLSGRIQVTEFDVGPPGVRLRNDGIVDIEIRRGDLRVQRAVFSGPSTRLNVTGEASYRRGLALAVNGELEAGPLAELSPRFSQASGRVTLRVNVSGPVNAPAIFGQAMVRDAGFRFVDFPEPVRDLSGLITFSSRRILFEDFTARMARGQILASGAATIQGTEVDRYDFDISARNINIDVGSEISVAFGGDAELRWSSEQRLPLLRGDIHLRRMRYEKDIALSQTLTELSRARRATVEQYDPDADRIELDLRLIDDAPILVANNLIDAEIRIEDSERPFRIAGTDQRLGAVGSLRIGRGVMHFRGADFDVRRGLIEFDNPQRIDPSFDVAATSEIRRAGEFTGPNWRINLHAHGTTDSFRLDTSSEPELSQEDIVLLLTVGMTRAEADQLQAGDLTSTAALEALTAATGIDREVQRALPVIDQFSITSRYSARTNRTEPQVSIGKRITDRVRLTASTNISETREIRTGVEWQLNNETSLQVVYDNVNTTTSAATVGNIGVDVRWRLEFE
ncbi:MAG: translocation/assembly module TamB domain-containing protein [Myxococcota bacterium]